MAQAVATEKAVYALEKIGPPPYRGEDLFVQRRWLSHYKGDTYSTDMLGVIALGLAATKYSLGDFVRYVKGAKYSNRHTWGELMQVDLLAEVQELSIAAFFFVGRHDYTASFALAEEFYQALTAPAKRLVWFEDSAHMPNVEEPQKFQREIIEVWRGLGIGAS